MGRVGVEVRIGVGIRLGCSVFGFGLDVRVGVRNEKQRHFFSD